MTTVDAVPFECLSFGTLAKLSVMDKRLGAAALAEMHRRNRGAELLSELRKMEELEAFRAICMLTVDDSWDVLREGARECVVAAEDGGAVPGAYFLVPYQGVTVLGDSVMAAGGSLFRTSATVQHTDIGDILQEKGVGIYGRTIAGLYGLVKAAVGEASMGTLLAQPGAVVSWSTGAIHFVMVDIALQLLFVSDPHFITSGQISSIAPYVFHRVTHSGWLISCLVAMAACKRI